MKFLDKEITGHLVAASSPATESLENLQECAQKGLGAAILKSASSCRLHDAQSRRCYLDKEQGYFWCESGFDKEILPLEEAVRLTNDAVNKTSMVIVPSVTEMTLNRDQWLASCKKLETAGAHGLQLDFFYFPNIMAETNFTPNLIELLKCLKEKIGIPIMPKLSRNFPENYAAEVLKAAGIRYVSLLDSIRSPKPAGADLTGKGLSVFGQWMFPLTRQYTQILAANGFVVCAGGGVTNGEMAIELLRLGASTIQIATEILLHGAQRFSEIENEIIVHQPVVEREYSGARKAMFIPELCTGCGKCAEQLFCREARNLWQSNQNCYGCGLCAKLCLNGAIKIVPVN